MQTFSTLPDAIALAKFAHSNQRDKAGLPYIDHPLRVLANVQAMGGQPYVQMSAVLHDVVEDTPFSLDVLEQLGFAEPVLIVVGLLTRTEEVAPDEYYKAIKNHPGALLVKRADISDNLLEWRLSYLSEKTQARLRAKYSHALEMLQ